MPKWGYSIIEEMLNPEKTAKASGRELKVSHKAAQRSLQSHQRHDAKQCKTVFTGCMQLKRKLFPIQDTIKNCPIGMDS